MSAYLIFSDRTLDFATSGGWYPQFDFAGRKLQDLASPDRLESITYSALPFPGGGVVAFVWDSTHGASCVQFVQSLDAIPTAGVPDALVRLSYGCFENTFADPRWWKGLQNSEREHLEQRFVIAADPYTNLSPLFLVEDGRRIARWKVIAREWR